MAIATNAVMRTEQERFAKELGVEYVNVVYEREKEVEPDLIEFRSINGQRDLSKAYKFWHRHVQWIVNGKRYEGLVPVKVRINRYKRTIIPLIWSEMISEPVVDNEVMFEELKRMVEESRQMSRGEV